MRKIIASLFMLGWLAFWIWLASVIGARLAEAPRWAQMIFYIIAGVGWILPMKPVFAWMNQHATPEDD